MTIKGMGKENPKNLSCGVWEGNETDRKGTLMEDGAEGTLLMDYKDHKR